MKKIFSINSMLILILILSILVGCSNENSTTYEKKQEEDIIMINEFSNQLSKELAIEESVSKDLSQKLLTVGVTSIVDIVQISKDEHVWRVIITDEHSGDYCLSLSPRGNLGLIRKDSFEGEPIYYEKDD